MALTGAFNGTRVNDSNANTNWSRFQTGGGAPAAESPLAYQGGLAVNAQVKATASTEGIDYDHTGTATFDMTAAANRLWFVKIVVSDSFAINATRGAEVGAGSTSGNYDRYVLSGSQSVRDVYTEYPAQGGYLITAVAPSVASWQDALAGTEEGPVGTPDHTSVGYFYGACRMATGAAKSENLALDAIDIGTGLTITGTTPDANFKNFYYFDQNGDITNVTPTTTNRWGVTTGSGDAVTANGMLSFGNSGGTLTTSDDSTSVVTWPDAYTDVGLFGVTYYCNNASNVHTCGALLISEGSPTTVDTRADFIVSGTTAGASLTLNATINNFRNITLTSVVTATNANIECQLLTPGSATIGSSTTTTQIRTNAITSVACLQDFPDTDSTSISYVDFVQTGVGHAIEMSTVGGNYTLSNCTFTGYGADSSASAAIDVTAASGTTTITLSGTTQPTFITAGATVAFVSSVPIAITVQDAATTAIQNAQVAVYLVSDDSEVLNELTTVAGLADGNTSANADIYIRVFLSTTGGTRYVPVETVANTGSTGISLTVTLLEDEIVNA